MKGAALPQGKTMIKTLALVHLPLETFNLPTHTTRRLVEGFFDSLFNRLNSANIYICLVFIWEEVFLWSFTFVPVANNRK